MATKNGNYSQRSWINLGWFLKKQQFKKFQGQTPPQIPWVLGAWTVEPLQGGRPTLQSRAKGFLLASRSMSLCNVKILYIYNNATNDIILHVMILWYAMSFYVHLVPILNHTYTYSKTSNQGQTIIICAALSIHLIISATIGVQLRLLSM